MNNKISNAQLQALIIISALGFEILILPKLVTSLIQLVIVLAISFLLCILALKSNIHIEKSKALCYIYSVKNIIVLTLLTKILADTVKSLMLTNTKIYLIILIIVLVIGYGGIKGIEVIARIGQMFFWFVVVGTIYVYAMAVPDIDFSNFSMGINTIHIVRGAIFGFVINIAEIIILLKGHLKNESSEILKGVCVSIAMVFAITFVIIGRLGQIGIEKVEYPLFEIMYTSDLPNVFIKRQEGIFISLWIISALISIFIYFVTTVEFMSAISIKKKSSVILLMIFIFIIAVLYEGNMRALRTYCFLQIIGGIFTVLIIPLIYIVRRNKID